jgi:glycosyltransferase involved in cell wall biosynthesis
MNKIKVVRLVTSNYCVKTHLHNVLKRVPNNIELFVIGDEVSIFTNKYKRVKFIDLPIKRNFNLYYDFLVFFKLIFLYFTIKPEICHSIMTKAGLLNCLVCKILNIKSVHTFTGQIWKTEKGIKRYLLKLNDMLIAKFSTKCLSDSYSQSTFLFDNNIKKNKNKIDVLGNGSISGVDLKVFSPDVKLKYKSIMRKELFIPDDAFVISFIARKSTEKGAIDILEIFQKVLMKKKVFLLFAGPDESNGLVAKFLNSNPHLNKYIIVLDFINDHFKYISVSDLNCLPSHREGFGSIVIDSSAMGVPSLGYNIPGLIDSIENNFSGILFKEGNINCFAEKIVYLANNRDELLKLSTQSYKYCKQNFDADLINDLKYNYYFKK